MIASLGLVLGGGLPAGADSNLGVGNPNPGAGGHGDPAPSAGQAGQAHSPGNPGQGNSGTSANAPNGNANANASSHAGNGAKGGGAQDAPGGGGGASQVTTDVPRPEPTAVSAPSVTGGGSSSSANHDCGEYCALPGDPSANGNGGGNAGGRPAAGTVGKADDKNPPGQFRNGGDPNNGYECDGNHGIARGNPAHTRNCPPAQSPPPVPPLPPGNPTVNSLVTTVTPTQLGTPATPSLAVLGVMLERPGAAPAPTAAARARVLGVTIERGATGALASTGTNSIDMGVLGMGLILGGAALTRANRRRLKAA